jgi:hypothetical protein
MKHISHFGGFRGSTVVPVFKLDLVDEPTPSTPRPAPSYYHQGRLYTLAIGPLPAMLGTSTAEVVYDYVEEIDPNLVRHAHLLNPLRGR